MIWFDSHAHLQDEVFDRTGRTSWNGLRPAHVGRILLPASDLADSQPGDRAGPAGCAALLLGRLPSA